MAVKVVLAKAHEAQLKDPEIRRELESVSEQINKTEENIEDGVLSFAFLKGMYVHSERKMITVCLFINRLEGSIKEINGTVKLKFKEGNAQIAKMTVALDEAFMGTLNQNEAMLVHFKIPVKGLSEDENFPPSEIESSFENVSVIYV